MAIFGTLAAMREATGAVVINVTYLEAHRRGAS